MMEIKKSILAGLAFGIFMGLYFGFRYGFEETYYSGPLSGLLFGVGIYLFATYNNIKLQAQIENENQDKLIHSGAANHFRNGIAIGGRLYLTSDGLQFKSHNFNKKNHSLKINLQDIQEMNFFNTLGLIPNGLEIQTEDGRIERFVVDGRKRWLKKIERIKTGHNNGEHEEPL